MSEGASLQQSAIGGVSSASSSMSVRSFGRSYTHTLSSLSTASPVTPPIFHLLGRGLGQSGSNLNLGAVSSCAPTEMHKANRPRPANTANAVLHADLSLVMNPSGYRVMSISQMLTARFFHIGGRITTARKGHTAGAGWPLWETEGAGKWSC